MNTKILVTLFILGVLSGCGKDKYTSKPQLTYKGVNTKELNRNQTLRFTLEVTDAEGDLQDSIWVEEVVRNCSVSGFKSQYKMPDFTAVKNFKGEIEVCYSFGTGLECPPIVDPGRCQGRNDSAYFRFWVQDKEKNVSDTIKSEEVVVLL